MFAYQTYSEQNDAPLPRYLHPNLGKKELKWQMELASNQLIIK